MVHTELGTLERDTFYPDCFIRISNVGSFNFFRNPLLFEYSTEKCKTAFLKLEIPSHFYINFKYRSIFQISRILIRDSDWLNFIHLSVED